ncbi:uncharacterized protein LOC124497741 [Dermatophagoides farinae]|uniref:uncharacterized protein LOC124497741 n=1 Tax=Dermatophagoides farinae TaxID=6954 RepID=UPI003F5F132F
MIIVMMTINLLIIIMMMMMIFPLLLCNGLSICPFEYFGQYKFNVYAADNLHNGTIRLYSHRYYIDFLFYHHYDDYNGNYRSIISINGHENETKRLIMFAMEKRLIQETYWNLSTMINFMDTFHQRITVFTLMKHNYDDDDENTFIIITKRSSKLHLIGDFYHIQTNNGMVREYGSLPTRIEQQQQQSDNQTINESNIFIHMDSAFRLSLNGQQFLFTIINRRLFWTIIMMEHFNDNDVELVNDSDGQFHRGPIPQMTAAFTIQSENLIALFIINCNRRCIVQWIYNESKFDFGPCSYRSNWIHLEPLMWMDNTTANDERLKRFSNDNLDLKLFSTKQFWYGIFGDDSNIGAGGIGQRFLNQLRKPISWIKVNYRILSGISIIILVMMAAMTGFLCYEHQFRNQDYNVAEQERKEEEQQLEQQVQQEEEPMNNNNSGYIELN